MSTTRGTISSMRSAKYTTLYTPYFWKPLWACSPDAATLVPLKFDSENKVTFSTKVSNQKAPCTAGAEDPFAHSRATRSYVDNIAYLVQETAVSPHDATACIITTELQMHEFLPFATASISRVALGSSASASLGSAAPNSLSDMAIPSQRPSVKTHTRNFSDIAAKKSVPVVPPGLGYDVPLLVTRPRSVSQVASFGVIGDRCGAEGLLDVTGVRPPSDISQQQGSCAIPCVVAPKGLEFKGVAGAFSDLSAHFLYSLAIRASADQFFPDPQLHGRTYVTSVIGPRIQGILECVSNPQVVVIHALWIADKSVNDTYLASKLWEDITTIPSTILNNVERTALRSLGYLGNIPRDLLHDFIPHLRSCATYLSDSNYYIVHRILDDVLAVNKATEINTTFIRYQGRKKKSAVAPLPKPPVIHAPIPVKPLTCLPDPNNWCPAADPIVNKNPRATGIAPGSHNFAPDFRQATTALDLLELITQGKSTGMRCWGAAVGGPLSTFGARLVHTVGLYGPCQTTLG